MQGVPAGGGEGGGKEREGWINGKAGEIVCV